MFLQETTHTFVRTKEVELTKEGSDEGESHCDELRMWEETTPYHPARKKQKKIRIKTSQSVCDSLKIFVLLQIGY